MHSCGGIISQAGATASPRPAPEACLSAHRGAVQEVEELEAAGLRELVPGTLSCPLSSPRQARLGEFHFQDHPLTHSPAAAPCLPQTFRVLWVFRPGQSSRTVGVSTLSALGTILTCNHSGKQPPAGLGKGQRGEGEGELQQTRRETKASSGAHRGVGAPAGGASPGWPALKEAGGACSLGLSAAGGWPAAGAVCGARTQGLEVLKVGSRAEEKKEGR